MGKPGCPVNDCEEVGTSLTRLEGPNEVDMEMIKMSYRKGDFVDLQALMPGMGGTTWPTSLSLF